MAKTTDKPKKQKPPEAVGGRGKQRPVKQQAVVPVT